MGAGYSNSNGCWHAYQQNVPRMEAAERCVSSIMTSASPASVLCIRPDLKHRPELLENPSAWDTASPSGKGVCVVHRRNLHEWTRQRSPASATLACPSAFSRILANLHS